MRDEATAAPDKQTEDLQKTISAMKMDTDAFANKQSQDTLKIQEVEEEFETHANTAFHTAEAEYTKIKNALEQVSGEISGANVMGLIVQVSTLQEATNTVGVALNGLQEQVEVLTETAHFRVELRVPSACRPWHDSVVAVFGVPPLAR